MQVIQFLLFKKKKKEDKVISFGFLGQIWNVVKRIRAAVSFGLDV